MPIYAHFDCYYSALAAARKGVVHVYAAQGGGEFRCTVAVGGGGLSGLAAGVPRGRAAGSPP